MKVNLYWCESTRCKMKPHGSILSLVVKTREVKSAVLQLSVAEVKGG